MTTLYHVCRDEWDGGDLLPLCRRMAWGDEVVEYIAANWPDVAGNEYEYYYGHEASRVHCHATIEAAREFAAEFGGQVLEIDATDLRIETGREYPHPVCESVPARCIKIA